MDYKIIIEILTALGTIGAVAIGFAAIYHSNKNSKREIKIHKLEEIFQLIQSLSRYYGKFNELNLCIINLRDGNKKGILTLSDYYNIRDEKLSHDDRQKILAHLSRLEVLAKCYTEAPIINELLKYEDLMFSFSDLVFYGGSLHQEINWKNGFPDFDGYFNLTESLKNQIVNQIKKK